MNIFFLRNKSAYTHSYASIVNLVNALVKASFKVNPLKCILCLTSARFK